MGQRCVLQPREVGLGFSIACCMAAIVCEQKGHTGIHQLHGTQEQSDCSWVGMRSAVQGHDMGVVFLILQLPCLLHGCHWGRGGSCNPGRLVLKLQCLHLCHLGRKLQSKHTPRILQLRAKTNSWIGRAPKTYRDACDFFVKRVLRAQCSAACFIPIS